MMIGFANYQVRNKKWQKYAEIIGKKKKKEKVSYWLLATDTYEVNLL